MSFDLECDDLVLGGGVIGLATGVACTKMGRSVVLIERNAQFGQETSSRNSEVVHSGIYYPPESLKTRFCIEGRSSLYARCREKNIAHRKTGKYVIATTDEEVAYLERLRTHAESLDVPVEQVTASTLRVKEPLVRCLEGLFFPESGIVDSHQFMQSLENEFLNREGLLGYRHVLESLHQEGHWIASVQTPEATLKIKAMRVLNTAGLAAAAVSNAALGTTRYEHRFCRGRYFSLSNQYTQRFQSLIYPVPPKDGLGVHVTVDCDGYARLGPDVDWLEERNSQALNPYYDCDWESVKPGFLAAAQRYCPTLDGKDLSPGLIGIRPKLFIDGKAYPDFLVEGQNGFVHCLGIESPGLTAALPIAHHAASLQA